MTSHFVDMTSRHFFDVVIFLLSILVTGPSFMSISSLVLELWQFSFIRDWPEIGNSPVWVLPNIWRLGRVRNTKFGTKISNKILLNAAKCQGCSFTVSELFKENQQGMGKITPCHSTPPSTQIRVKGIVRICILFLKKLRRLFLYLIYELVQIFITFNRTDVSLFKQVIE